MSCWNKCPKVIQYFRRHPEEAELVGFVFPKEVRNRECVKYKHRSNENGYYASEHEDYEKYSALSQKISSDKHEELMKEKEEKQKLVDDYILNKGWNYFSDYCTCSTACLIYHLWHDEFVKSSVYSLLLFGIGVKLCYELDGINLLKK